MRTGTIIRIYQGAYGKILGKHAGGYHIEYLHGGTTFITKSDIMNKVELPSLSAIQKNLPWVIKYSKQFNNDKRSHKDFEHAFIHATKALGKISEFIEDADHNKASIQSSHNLEKYLADLVICALRMSNTNPIEKYELLGSVVARLCIKNNIDITELQDSK